MRNTTANFQRDAEKDASDKDIGFWVRLGTEGSWESIRSLLPLSVVPKSVQSEFIAVEVVMKNGKKHAILRGLATIVNDSDINLDISVCHASMIQDSGSNSHNIVVEEIFENQRYQPISGWGNKWSSFRGNDPGRWSTKDFSYSSKVSVFAYYVSIFLGFISCITINTYLSLLLLLLLSLSPFCFIGIMYILTSPFS